MPINPDKIIKKVNGLLRLSQQYQQQQKVEITSKIDWNSRLVNLIPQISNDYSAPYHLESYCSIIDEAISRATDQSNRSGEYVAHVVATPPQHGKTISSIHGLLKTLKLVQNGSSAFVSYSQ